MVMGSVISVFIEVGQMYLGQLLAGTNVVPTNFTVKVFIYKEEITQ